MRRSALRSRATCFLLVGRRDILGLHLCLGGREGALAARIVVGRRAELLLWRQLARRELRSTGLLLSVLDSTSFERLLGRRKRGGRA